VGEKLQLFRSVKKIVTLGKQLAAGGYFEKYFVSVYSKFYRIERRVPGYFILAIWTVRPAMGVADKSGTSWTQTCALVGAKVPNHFYRNPVAAPNNPKTFLPNSNSEHSFRWK
jgi:hypothetical protein